VKQKLAAAIATIALVLSSTASNAATLPSVKTRFLNSVQTCLSEPRSLQAFEARFVSAGWPPFKSIAREGRTTRSASWGDHHDADHTLTIAYLVDEPKNYFGDARLVCSVAVPLGDFEWAADEAARTMGVRHVKGATDEEFDFVLQGDKRTLLEHVMAGPHGLSADQTLLQLRIRRDPTLGSIAFWYERPAPDPCQGKLNCRPPVIALPPKPIPHSH
jgi:hypothetical protein